MKKQIWPTVIQGSRRQRLGPHGIHPVRRSLVFFCLKRACSFTVGIYNDVAMMFNNAYLFNVIYVYNYIYIIMQCTYPARWSFCHEEHWFDMLAEIQKIL